MNAKNILFIMCDQLRWDYLSCYGHPHLHTPHIDRLAQMGVRFDKAYVQSPICGPSRASVLTGRYLSSMGATTNFAPLRVDELNIGDHLNPLGMRTVLTGKTHIAFDAKGGERLKLSDEQSYHIGEGGFEATYRDDGLHPNDARSKHHHYNVWLREQGYKGDNPWHTHANSSVDDAGNVYDGWFLESASYPANIKEEHSETPYTFMRAMEYMREAGDTPWCLHLSLIKPHWPIVAPAPYHDMYSKEHFLPVNKSASEKENPHPIFASYMTHKDSQIYADEKVREYVLPAYMGLIKQIDDQMGKLFEFLEEANLMDDTMIVFTSDHGDYFGDHHLGEKDFFHDCAARIPLIIYDPSEAANATRGKVETRLVELIDLIPTFVDVAGGTPHFRLEGRSLLPLLHAQETDWREFAVCEVDFGDRRGPAELDMPKTNMWSVMLVDERYKYIAFNGMRPMLFDMQNDPNELNDLGEHPDFEGVRIEYKDKLLNWFMTTRWRSTTDDDDLYRMGLGLFREKKGVIIGYWDEEDLPEEVQLHRKWKTA